MDPETLKQYLDEIAREQLIRDAAFVVDRESICGIEVLPMTTRMHVRLCIVRSPFLIRGMSREVVLGSLTALQKARAIFEFLWIIHPKYSPRSWLRRNLFYRRIARMDQASMLEGILAYMEETFWDLMEGGSGGKAKYSHAAGAVFTVAARLPWSEADLMDMPIKRLLQYRNIIHGISGGIICNRSDRIRVKWRASQNEKRMQERQSQQETTNGNN